MYNMSLGDMGDKFGHMFSYGLYGIICVVAALFVGKLVPETKGKTLEAVSYTHLDVYKRQVQYGCLRPRQCLASVGQVPR